MPDHKHDIEGMLPGSMDGVGWPEGQPQGRGPAPLFGGLVEDSGGAATAGARFAAGHYVRVWIARRFAAEDAAGDFPETD